MKASAIISAFVVLLPLISICEVDPFEPALEAPRPDRVISRMPNAISYSKDDEDRHTYVIAGIYANSPKRDIENPGELVSVIVPSSIECTFDFTKRTCTITTSRILTLSELAYAIDDIAELGGDMPYWAELVARDLPESVDYAEMEFETAEFVDPLPKGLAWFWLSGSETFEMPYAFGNRFGSIIFVPTTAHCMCHSRYGIRILDPDRKLVWTDMDTAFASIAVTVTDVDEDLSHEILIRRDDHGDKTSFRIQRKANKAEMATPRKPSD